MNLWTIISVAILAVLGASLVGFSLWMALGEVARRRKLDNLELPDIGEKNILPDVLEPTATNVYAPAEVGTEKTSSARVMRKLKE